MSKVSTYLNNQGIDFKTVNRASGPQAIAQCPFCHGGDGKDKNSFAVNLENGAWNCLRLNQCGRQGSWYDLVQALGGEYKSLDDSFYSKPKRNYTKPQVKFNPIPDQAKKYLMEERKISEDILRKFKVTSSNGRIALPYYRDGEIVNVKYRGKGKGNWKEFSQEKQCRPTLYGADMVKPEMESLIITEGEFDALSLAQYGYDNVVSIPGGAQNDKWIEEEWDFLEAFKIIYLVMDNDEAGKEALRVFAKRLGIWRCKGVTLPLKDANECLCKGLELKDVHKAFSGAVDFKHEKLERVLSYESEIINIIENPCQSHGTPTGLRELDHVLKGWRGGEVTLWTGYNGSGKSTMLGQMMLHLANQKISSCIASMELPPKRYLRWQVLQITGNHNTEDARLALKWLNDYQFVANYQNTVDRNDLLDVFNYAARKYGVKHFVVDSLMKIKMDLRQLHESQKDFVDQLTYLAKRYDAHVHLVAHPRKGESDNSEAGKMDVKGASEITDLVDNVVVIGRSLKGDMNESGMVVKKNREHGFLGQFPLDFCERSKRFSTTGDTIEFNYKSLEDEWTH